MSPARKEYSNDFRELRIKHYLNVDSEREIASQMLCSRNTMHSMITKYKKRQGVLLICLVMVENEKQQPE